MGDLAPELAVLFDLCPRGLQTQREAERPRRRGERPLRKEVAHRGHPRLGMFHLTATLTFGLFL